VGDRPITSGYRNDAKRIDTEVFQSAGADSLAQATGLTLLEQDFESALAAIPSGYGEGVYEGLRYGVTVRKSRDGKRTNLFARALAGGDVVSFNLYRLRSGEDSLRPCEMSAEKVVAFVLGYVPDLPKA
jgi:hypothetical protein